MSKKRYASVWDAIEDTPAEAENMKLRSALMIVLNEYIKGEGWTQAEAAQRLGVTQPRVSDLMRGKIDLFGLDTLVNMATSVGLKVQMHVRGVRRKTARPVEIAVGRSLLRHGRGATFLASSILADLRARRSPGVGQRIASSVLELERMIGVERAEQRLPAARAGVAGRGRR
jgi:predicted XRE-type DNA-binding protein